MDIANCMELRLVRAWHHAPACIFRRLDNIHSFGMIPYSPYGLRTYRLRRISSTATPWFGCEGCERRTKWQKISCLNIQKNLPQNVNYSANLSAEIPTPFFSFANPHQACLLTSPRLSDKTMENFLIPTITKKSKIKRMRTNRKKM